MFAKMDDNDVTMTDSDPEAAPPTPSSVLATVRQISSTLSGVLSQIEQKLLTLQPVHPLPENACSLLDSLRLPFSRVRTLHSDLKAAPSHLKRASARLHRRVDHQMTRLSRLRQKIRRVRSQIHALRTERLGLDFSSTGVPVPNDFPTDMKSEQQQHTDILSALQQELEKRGDLSSRRKKLRVRRTALNTERELSQQSFSSLTSLRDNFLQARNTVAKDPTLTPLFSLHDSSSTVSTSSADVTETERKINLLPSPLFDFHSQCEELGRILTSKLEGVGIEGMEVDYRLEEEEDGEGEDNDDDDEVMKDLPPLNQSTRKQLWFVESQVMGTLDAAEEWENRVLLKSRKRRKVTFFSTSTPTTTTTTSSSSFIENTLTSQLFPLYLRIKIKRSKDSSFGDLASRRGKIIVLCFEIRWLENFNLVLAKGVVDPDERIVRNLWSGDKGEICPNGLIGGLRGFDFANSVIGKEFGRPYRWAQSMCGLVFSPVEQHRGLVEEQRLVSLQNLLERVLLRSQVVRSLRAVIKSYRDCVAELPSPHLTLASCEELPTNGVCYDRRFVFQFSYQNLKSFTLKAYLHLFSSYPFIPPQWHIRLIQGALAEHQLVPIPPELNRFVRGGGGGGGGGSRRSTLDVEMEDGDGWVPEAEEGEGGLSRGLREIEDQVNVVEASNRTELVGLLGLQFRALTRGLCEFFQKEESMDWTDRRSFQ